MARLKTLKGLQANLFFMKKKTVFLCLKHDLKIIRERQIGLIKVCAVVVCVFVRKLLYAAKVLKINCIKAIILAKN